MSVKTRGHRIDQATSEIIITGKTKAGLIGVIESNGRNHQWSFHRMNNQTVIFGQYKVDAIVYQTMCSVYNDATGTQNCKGNSFNTVCYHCLSAYKEAMRLAGFTVYNVEHARDARQLMNLGCKFIKLLNHNGTVVFRAIKRNPSPKSSLDNLKQLINQKRVGINQPGQKMPIGPDVEAYVRSDGQIAIKRGLVTSKPVARWGRDWDVQSTANGGQWKLTTEAEKNYQEFIEGIEQ